MYVCTSYFDLTDFCGFAWKNKTSRTWCRCSCLLKISTRLSVSFPRRLDVVSLKFNLCSSYSCLEFNYFHYKFGHYFFNAKVHIPVWYFTNKRKLLLLYYLMGVLILILYYVQVQSYWVEYRCIGPRQCRRPIQLYKTQYDCTRTYNKL